ncbi:orotidine-5'-phosphate decarboxylase [Phenylobacterium koreense]|uniref:Orotidine-5'-phosphate decarboxylase n=1 Tax=Phenylobacterium koreense TaxID=266125 RepID=A0ABV2ELW4_9CAUL
MQTFAERFADLAQRRSPLCVGLDPSEDVFAHWGLPSDAAGLRRFCDVVLDAVSDRVAVVKPQAAFFERFGPPGMTQLAEVCQRLREQGVLSLIDAKRGDVAGTMMGYAAAMLGEGSGFGGDAMTVNAYLGFEALHPVFDQAAASGSMVFVVVRSSNPEGRALQSARLDDGRTLTEALADDVVAAHTRMAGAVGAVVGATIGWESTKLLERLPHTLILAPGVGAQGAELQEVGRKFARARGRVLPSVSRDVLRRGPSAKSLGEAIDRYRDLAWSNCGAAT